MTLQRGNRPNWRQILDEQGRTLTWLAKKTGTPRPTVYSYSQRVYRPSEDWLERVAVVLGVPVELLREDREAA